MEYIELGYIGLFIACFLSATILPFASEGVVAYFVLDGFDPLLVWSLATVANSSGSLSNYALGMLSSPDKIKSRLKRPDRFERLSQKAEKYGFWLAAFAWVPIIGDPLTIVLGFFRVRFVPFLILLILTKGLRYLVIIYLLM